MKPGRSSEKTPLTSSIKASLKWFVSFTQSTITTGTISRAAVVREQLTRGLLN